MTAVLENLWWHTQICKIHKRDKARVGTVSGTSISFGTTVEFEAGGVGKPTKTSNDVSSGKIVIAYRDSGNSDYGTVITGTVSGTSISFDTALVIENSATYEFGAVYDASAEKTVIFYQDEGDSYIGKICRLSTSKHQHKCHNRKLHRHNRQGLLRRARRYRGSCRLYRPESDRP